MTATSRRIDYHGRLDGRTELGDGSVRFTARLTRVGVFDYGDHKELRTEEEVFDEKTLDSFRGLAVTDGHAAWIDADNWRTHAKGHVGDDVRRDGEYVVASVVIKDAALLKKIDAKERAEVSMGYSVDVEPSKGRTDDGEDYDSIQKNIRGNHAAIGPRDWGRAGPNVRLLDGSYALAMSDPQKRIDAPSNEKTDAAKLDEAQKKIGELETERDGEKTRADAAEVKSATLEAERDAARKDADEAKKSLETQKASEQTRVDARVDLILRAKAIHPKLDAKGTDREIREAALRHVDASANFEGKADAYVEAAFDIATKKVADEREALGAVQTTVTTPAATKSKLDEAEERAAKERAERNKDGPPVCAVLVRKN